MIAGHKTGISLMRLSVGFTAIALMALAACQDQPKSPAVSNAKALEPPKYTQTGSRVTTDHPLVTPDVGVMSQGALQDATGDHTGPGYNQTLPNPQ